MSKERFEIFGKIIKDNEEEPNLLDNYLATVRLNEFNEKIKDLQSQLDQANERLKAISEPKYRIGQEVWCIAFEQDWNRYCIIKYKVKSYVPNNNGAMLELIESDCPRNICYYYESQVFDTSLEARAELRKLESKE